VKAITLFPEMAFAVAHLGKDTENRTWWPPKYYKGDLAIHAGQRHNPAAAAFITDLGFKLPPRDEIPTGTVVAVVTVGGHHDDSNCECECSPWALPAPHLGKPMRHWPLSNRRLVTHIPVLGRLGWWDLPPAVDIAIHAQLMARAGR
jgi:hypothetical protein